MDKTKLWQDRFEREWDRVFIDDEYGLFAGKELIKSFITDLLKETEGKCEYCGYSKEQIKRMEGAFYETGEVKSPFVQKLIDQATQDAVEAERSRIESLIPEKILDKRGEGFYETEGFNEAIKVMLDNIKV